MGDWTSATYVASQIVTAIAYFVGACSFFVKNRRRILLIIILENIVLAMAFVLLDSWVGVGMCGVAIVRDIVQLIIGSKSTTTASEQQKINKTDTALLFVWIIAPFVITLFTYEHPLDWFALVATLIFVFSIWQKNVFFYRFLGIFVSIAWLIYQAALSSLFGVIFEGIILMVTIAGVIHYVVKHKRKQISKKTLSEQQP